MKRLAMSVASHSREAARLENAHGPIASTIAYYQKLGCWTPHVEITRLAFEVALDVFQHSGLITKRHRYEDVVATPPDAA